MLDFLRTSKDHNPIFARHVMMLLRHFHVSLEWFAARYRATLPARFHDVPHIHIDTGSPACTDMTYTRATDIYLGDVSS